MLSKVRKIRTLGKIFRNLRNHWVYLGDYLGLLKNKDLIYKFRNGVNYKVRGGSTDRFIVNEIAIHKMYTPKGFEIRKTDKVVDIGAHIGVFSMLAAHEAKQGKVYSFEPSPENFVKLKENIELNGFRNVEAVNAAASDTAGKMKFFISKTKNKGQNSSRKINNDQEEVQVNKISFAAFLRKLDRVDFLKMDCEGSEYDILFSLNKKELSKIKKISMEYHNYSGRNGKELKELLERVGFIVKMIPEGKLFGTIYAFLRE